MAMSEEMERSLRLLESALSPTNPHDYSPFGFRGGKRNFVDPSFNLEETFDETLLSRANFSKLSKIRPSDVKNLSITLAPNEISKLWDTTENTNVAVSDLDNLYQQFQEAIELHGTPQQAFDAVSSFIEACTITIETLSERGFRDKDATGITKSGLSWLVNERNTWRLIFVLYRDRLLHQEEEEDISECLVPYEHPISEKEAMLDLYKNESSVREGQLIIDWLERVACDDLEDMGARVGHCVDRTVAWENTLHQLGNTQVPYMSTRELVMALDPDAPTREMRSLHDLDIEDESRLLEQVFFEIRRGCLEKAQELCVHCGQAWRAASLEGWRLHHDPNFRMDNQKEKVPVTGNPHRDIWKLCAWRLCEDERVPTKARASMGALCGHLDALLTSCPSWEDVLWARLRVSVDHKVERAVRDAALREYLAMPNKYWNDAQSNLEEIFREMHGTEGLVEECESPDRIVQELVTLDQVGELIRRMATWVETGSPQFLRFLAHCVIVMRLVGRSTPTDPGDVVIAAYVKVLMEDGDPKLVAYYVAMLQEEEQIDLYSSFMEAITEDAKRQECLNAAENCGLNVKTITKRVVQNIRDRVPQGEDAEDALSKEITDSDLCKISALDWVIYYPQQRVEALWQANILIRTFIGQGKLDCARRAFNKIPENSIELILNQYKCQVDFDFRADLKVLPPKVNATLREYLCLKAYLDAQEGFSDWFYTFHNTKPIAPPEPDEANYPDRLTYEHKMSQYSQALERWKITMGHQAKAVKSQLYNVIIFPDTGWLVDDYDEDEVRKSQLETLRNHCLPQIVMLLQTVLHQMEDYEACLDLASLVMDEEFGIYKTFNQHQLKDLLVKMSESSTSLLSLCGDPFGDFGPDTD